MCVCVVVGADAAGAEMRGGDACACGWVGKLWGKAASSGKMSVKVFEVSVMSDGLLSWQLHADTRQRISG